MKKFRREGRGRSLSSPHKALYLGNNFASDSGDSEKAYRNPKYEGLDT
jgi:hypothetical protein